MGGAAVRPVPIDVDLPGAVPGWLVRLVPAAVVLMLGAAVGTAGAGGPALAVALVLAVVAAWRPSGAVGAAVALSVGVAVLIGRQDLLVGTRVVLLAVLVLGVHAVAAGTALSRHVAWRGLVDPAALGRLVLEMVPVQVASQILVLAAWGLRTGGSSLAWRAVGALALAALVLLVVPRRAARPGAWQGGRQGGWQRG